MGPAWVLHGSCMGPAWVLHGSCMGPACMRGCDCGEARAPVGLWGGVCACREKGVYGELG